MPGGRRGLVAPQNTFLENIIRRSNSQRKCYFLMKRAFQFKLFSYYVSVDLKSSCLTVVYEGNSLPFAPRYDSHLGSKNRGLKVHIKYIKECGEVKNLAALLISTPFCASCPHHEWRWRCDNKNISPYNVNCLQRKRNFQNQFVII